jgi:large subunit ribosomal protein L31
MKDGIHPKYYKTTATCVCGATYEVNSSIQNVRVDICAKCHPLYTGNLKVVDSAGRIDAFKKRFAKKTAETVSK